MGVSSLLPVVAGELVLYLLCVAFLLLWRFAEIWKIPESTAPLICKGNARSPFLPMFGVLVLF
uniref:Uncharacterized protein n=1 Tax=Anguilla anguilla TaxID=7936 RepID=A0A0E9WKK8_ANGAN